MADAPGCTWKARCRWFRLTPDRVVLGLLAVEGFLLLSEWFRWFPFNEHKGWTVLIAAATVVVAMLLMFLWFLAALVFRWRFQFSILALLALTVVVAVLCGRLAPERERARKQRDVVEEIKKAGGTVFYDYQLDPAGAEIPGAKPPGPAWLRKLLGDDLLVDVTRVDLTGPGFGDGWLDRIKALAQLQSLWLNGADVGDAGLEHLKGLTQLQELHLSGTAVTDAGLEHLKGLPKLQELYLGGIMVSDAGLKHLERLTRLEALWLNGTKIGDAGLKHLKGLTQLQGLNLSQTKVSDAGLGYLKGLTKLERLDLSATNVTDAGERDLQESLPTTIIRH
jgi:hypothetical protein